MKTLEEIMQELQTVETFNCTIERTETPPYYRLTSLRKGSHHSESNLQLASSRQDLTSTGEKGTIHTKRHDAGGQRENSNNIITAPFKSAGSMASSAGSAVVARIQMVGEKVRQAYTKPSLLSSMSATGGNDTKMTQSLVIPPQEQSQSGQMSQSEHQFLNFDFNNQKAGVSGGGKSADNEQNQPHPLPMPEYGGWFAPLTEFLPPPISSSQPIISSFHRSNLAVILVTDLVVDGLDLDCHGVDWSVHVPLMLHVVFLGLDNSRELVYK